ncbi:MAG: penicillin-binding protein 1C [Saprospiraceae bacterium]
MQRRSLSALFTFLKRLPRWVVGVIVLFVVWWFSLPNPLFNAAVSTVIEDSNGQLLGAKIASDGQWRFPPGDSLPAPFRICVQYFEDQRFWSHPGVDVWALARAIRQNVAHGGVVSGASTLNMQVIRMAKGNPPRTIGQKIIEILLALRLEVRYTKAEIMQLWASHAPFGGNVVGLEAACWRYFGKPPHLLSWGEAATLAVLPNSPALIHPGRNREQLKAKRNRLLQKLADKGVLDPATCTLAQDEPLPEAPLPLPQVAPHLLDRLVATRGAGRWVTTIDTRLQERVTQTVQQYASQIAGNGIHNMAVLVLDTETGHTLAYVGNVLNLSPEHSPGVDLIHAARSPGSLLKPILYNLAVQEGLILPQQLLEDIPTAIGGFRPENFNKAYNGAVPADEALARSLNIPFVRLLQQYGVAPFHAALKNGGFQHINRPPGHYGLSLILGGCEVSLWEVAGWYSSLGRMLWHYPQYQGQYNPADWRAPYLLAAAVPPTPNLQPLPPATGAGAAWATLAAMEQLERPDEEGNWESFESNRRIAWKTGTSFGFRDAWSVSVDPHYTLAVWVGNADGEGRPGLTGIKMAAPLLFNVRRLLPTGSRAWFRQPLDDMRQLSVCTQSGMLASSICPADSVWVPVHAQRGGVCHYHRKIHTNPAGTEQVHQQCVAQSEEVQARTWFVLPPLQAYYYQPLHPDYHPLPPWSVACMDAAIEPPMQWIYPAGAAQIKIPKTWDGQLSSVLFAATHRQANMPVHWHLDGQFLQTTTGEHTLELRPPPGWHHLLLVDAQGHRLEKRIEILP